MTEISHKKYWQRQALALLCWLTLGSSTVSGATAIKALDRIVAIVDQEAIMASELTTRSQRVHHQLEAKQVSVPAAAIFKQQVLEQLIMEAIQLQLGRKHGIRIDERALDDTIHQIAQRNMLTVSAFKQQLEADGLSYAEAREQIRREMIIQRVRQRYVGERVHVTEQDVDHFLQSPEGQAQQQTEYHLHHILFAISEHANTEQIKAVTQQANTVAKQLQQGADFAQMALTVSKGQNALNGGDLGWRKADQLPSLFVEQAQKMTKGQISEPVRSSSGFHIFKLVDVRGHEQQAQEQAHVRHILIQSNAMRNHLEAKLLAQKLYKRIKAGESLSDLAKVYSDDTASALNGGDLDWVNPNALAPEFRMVINTIPQNTISEPFKTQYGWHILTVLGKRQTDVSQQIRRQQAYNLLRNRQFEEKLSSWLQEIRAQAYIEIK